MSSIFHKTVSLLSILIMYNYSSSPYEVISLTLGYISCFLAYHYFHKIKAILYKFIRNVNVSEITGNMGHLNYFSDYKTSEKYRVETQNSFDVPIVNARTSSNLKSRNNSPSWYTKDVEDEKPSLMSNDEYNRDSGGRLKSSIISTKYSNLPSLVSRFRNESLRKRIDNNVDLETILNVSSPGFTSRVVDKAKESASYHIKYPAVRQISTYSFDKSILHRISKIPRTNSASLVRITQPEPNSINLSNIKATRKSEIEEHNFLRVMKDTSRKRNHPREEGDRSYFSMKKTRRNDIKSFVPSRYNKRPYQKSSYCGLKNENDERFDDSVHDSDKLMLYNMNLEAGDIEWNGRTKKRKFIIENMEDHSPEKMKKYAKASVLKKNLTDEKIQHGSSPSANFTHVVELRDLGCSSYVEPAELKIPHKDEERNLISNGAYYTYGQKLNCANELDMISVIASEPEYANEISHLKGNAMKKHRNLVDKFESERNDKIIVCENSIMGEIVRNGNYIENNNRTP